MGLHRSPPRPYRLLRRAGSQPPLPRLRAYPPSSASPASAAHQRISVTSGPSRSLFLDVARFRRTLVFSRRRVRGLRPYLGVLPGRRPGIVLEHRRVE